MPVLDEFYFDSCSCKNQIYVRQWIPDGEIAGIVQLCHGIGEYIERYDDLAQYLAERGYVVAGEDHLGHGRSAADHSELGYVGETEGWDLMVGDMRKLYERLRGMYGGKPHFILGHSMGSFLTRTYIIRYHDGPDGVILSGTGHQPKLLLHVAAAMAKFSVGKKGGSFHNSLLNSLAFGSYNKRIPQSSGEYDWLSRDTAVVKAYEEDPLCGPVPTSGLFYAMFNGLKEITSVNNIVRVNKDLPIYLYAGDADPVGGYGKGVRKTYDEYLRAGVKDVTLKLYEGARHECHNELCRADVYSDVLAWLEKHSLDHTAVNKNDTEQKIL